jgi:hypothetical protein
MADNIPSIAEIVDLLPLKLQRRFDSLGGYVQGIIEEERTQQDISLRLSSEDKQVIQLAAFIYMLDSFFRAGSRAAREASSTFERFELSGFQVGSTHFTSDNMNTLRGEVLARELRGVVLQTSLGTYIRSAQSMRDLVSWLVRDIKNEQTMG